MGNLLTAWSRKGVGRALADGENMPAAELTLFITTWVCVIASVHNFIPFVPLLISTSVHVCCFMSLNTNNSAVCYLKQYSIATGIFCKQPFFFCCISSGK